MTAPQREVVHPQHPWRRRGRIRQRLEQAQQSGPTHRGMQPGGQPGTGPPCQCDRDPLQHRPQQRCPPPVPHRQPRDLLHESRYPTRSFITEPSPHPQPHHQPPSTHRRVGQATLVPAVHPVRLTPATRTDHGRRQCGRSDTHRARHLFDRLDHHPGQVRKQHAHNMINTQPDIIPETRATLQTWPRPSRKVRQIPTLALKTTVYNRVLAVVA